MAADGDFTVPRGAEEKQAFQDDLDECRMLNEGCGCYQTEPDPTAEGAVVDPPFSALRWARWAEAVAAAVALIRTWSTGVLLVEIVLAVTLSGLLFGGLMYAFGR